MVKETPDESAARLSGMTLLVVGPLPQTKKPGVSAGLPRRLAMIGSV